MARSATDPQPRNRAARGLVAAIVLAPLLASSRDRRVVVRRTLRLIGLTALLFSSAGTRGWAARDRSADLLCGHTRERDDVIGGPEPALVLATCRAGVTSAHRSPTNDRREVPRFLESGGAPRRAPQISRAGLCPVSGSDLRCAGSRGPRPLPLGERYLARSLISLFLRTSSITSPSRSRDGLSDCDG
jgi:hypothetical protein